TVVSINIYNRTLNKLENTNDSKLTPGERKNNEIKHRTFSSLKDEYMSILSTLDPLINEELKMVFNDVPQDEMLNKISVEVKSGLLEKYYDLTQEQQDVVSFNNLKKATMQEKESQYNAVTQQMSKLGHDSKQKDAYIDVANQYNRIIDGLIHMFEEITKVNQ